MNTTLKIILEPRGIALKIRLSIIIKKYSLHLDDGWIHVKYIKHQEIISVV